MSEDDPKKKKDASKMNFALKRAEAGSEETFSNREARQQAKFDMQSLNRAINLLNKEMVGFRDEQNVGLTIDLENNKIFEKDGKTMIWLSGGGTVLGLASGVLKSTAVGVGGALLGLAVIPVGLKAFLHNNRRMVKKDYQDDSRGERDIVFEYGKDEIRVPVTPANMRVVAESYEAASEYLQSVRSEFQRGLKTKEEVAEGIRKTITDYILDRRAGSVVPKAAAKPSAAVDVDVTEALVPSIAKGPVTRQIAV